jgi:tRNA uridine 5-carboxymethylaminomethyl modification enzyme
MFTSRAEFRLHLRIDNADRRLTPYGRRVGLINDDAWRDYLAKQERMDTLRQWLEKTRVKEELPASILEKVGGHSAIVGSTFAQLLKRPELTIEELAPAIRQVMPDFFLRHNNRRGTTDGHLSAEVRNELKSVETEIKYAGYLSQQEKAIERLKRSEEKMIPDWFDYKSVSGLSREMNEKLNRVRPRTLGHASRIPGVTPAALSLINVYIEIQGRQRNQAQSAV